MRQSIVCKDVNMTVKILLWHEDSPVKFAMHGELSIASIACYGFARTGTHLVNAIFNVHVRAHLTL